MKTVYICFCTDVIHEGHMNIIREAEKYGTIIAGVLSDEVMVRYGRFLLISIEERIKLLEEIPQISKVVIQNEMMYEKILQDLKPDYVIHGDDWKKGNLKPIRGQERCHHHGQLLRLHL